MSVQQYEQVESPKKMLKLYRKLQKYDCIVTEVE